MTEDFIERTREMVLKQIAKEETLGTPVYSHFIDPTVTAANDPPFVYLGDGSPEIVTLPQGASVGGPNYPASQYPHAEVTPCIPVIIHQTCDGPGCEHTTQGLPMDAGWITVAHGKINHFCSLRCLANWLAGELAKEESR